MHIAAVEQLLLILLVSATFASSWAATIVHTPKVGQAAGSAISHQSFVRLSTAPQPQQQPQLILATPTVRIVNAKVNNGLEEVHHTPAHLTYAAHPVVHQMLPRIKPVRNISFASLRAQSHTLAHTHAHTHAHTQLQLV
ncbi:uncharacterized protein LOC26528627 [Drosophila mojavensis]|uniref:Uncharacterized protein n=1 Tax=Drosophila mojavensis TaxID=7230 RepID=A0A0Q9XTX5_DROMO|nr:uncharacterized protein LOC26528627 [Drosophila mojavensis]KRG07767.1 uncharacterized protein Dmoj_GI26986 [Drosophila mojavensis]